MVKKKKGGLKVDYSGCRSRNSREAFCTAIVIPRPARSNPQESLKELA